MTKREPHATNGRKGGEATLTKYGIEHYQRMAAIVRAKYGSDHYKRIGKKGGEAYNQRYIAGGLRGTIHPDDEVPL